MKRYLLAILAVLGITAARAEDIVYVKATGSNVEPYATEETAATTLDTAVAYANAQGIRKVKVVGTVVQNTQLSLADVEIYGEGWSAAGIQHTAGYVAPVFKIGANVLIHGLKFTSTSSYLRGYYHLTDASSSISNCWFSSLFCKSLQPDQELAGHVTAGLITHCLFSGIHTDNSGAKGSQHAQGVLDLSGTARMVNSIFVGNYHSGSLYGPCEGLIVVSGKAVLENCVIYGNYAKASKSGDDKGSAYWPRRGGGISVYSGSPTIRNCIVRNNKKPHAYDSGEEDIYSATEEGDFYIADGATPIIENCNIFEGQVPDCAVNCQTDDPKFKAPDASKFEDRDFSIAEDSPCVDAGLFQNWQAFVTDYTGVTPRYQGEGVDIGAYEVVKPTPPTAHIELGGTLEAEKYATATMSAFVTGLKVDSGATFKWYTSDPQEGTPEPFATGNPAEYRFTEGTWTIYLKIENADGEGNDLYGSVADAVVVTRGADFYVSATGDDEASGDIDAPFKTLEKAFESAKTIGGVARIRVIGRVTQSQMNYSVSNVEVFGGDRTEDMLVANTGGAQQDYPILVLGDNTFFHDLKVVKGTCSYLRTVLQLTSESAVVSNCWFSGLSTKTLYDKYGNICGYAKAGLVTHCLFTGCSCDNGGGEGTLGVNFLCLDGTAKMRNCIFTKNAITGNSRGDLAGVMAIMGNAVMENCVVYDNYVQDGGSTYKGRYTGGVFVRGGSPVIKDCIIRKNTMSAEGETKAHSQEADIYVAASATPKISFCNIPEGQVPECATNCQTGDPKFAKPDVTPADTRDFSIAADSPCVDAGNGRGWRKGSTDYAGNPRIQGRRVDIGAYEYNSGVKDWGLQILVR